MRHAAWSLVLGCLLFPSLLAAQELRGRVIADATGSPIEGAEIVLRDVAGRERARTLTGADGGFSLRVARDGTCLLAVARIGFATWQSDPFDLARADDFELEIRMGVEAIPLEPIRVVASAPGRNAEFRRRMLTRAGTGRFIGRDRIERATSLRTSDLLRTVPGLLLVQIMDPRFPGMGAPRYLLQGRQGCPAAVFVDGLRMSQGELMTIDDFTNPRMLDGVEFYASGAFAPTQFQAEGACGVVLFWTRPPEPTGTRWSWKRFGAFLSAIGFMIIVAR